MRFAVNACTLAAILSAALAGPAQAEHASQPAAPAGDTATFVFRKSYDRGFGPGTMTNQRYYHLPDHVCRGKRRVAAFSWMTGEEQERLLPAGQPLTLWMYTRFFSPGMQSTCQKAIHFTPRAGATYDVAFRSIVGNFCEVNIVDRATGQEPDGLSYDDKVQCN